MRVVQHSYTILCHYGIVLVRSLSARVFSRYHKGFCSCVLMPLDLCTSGSSPSMAELGDDRDQTYEATILLVTDRQITAVRQLAATVWIYSLFPKLGAAYFSVHRDFPLGDVSSSVSLYTLC